MFNNQANSSALDRHGQIDQVIGHLQLLRSLTVESGMARPSGFHGNFMGDFMEISWGFHDQFFVGNDKKY